MLCWQGKSSAESPPDAGGVGFVSCWRNHLQLLVKDGLAKPLVASGCEILGWHRYVTTIGTKNWASGLATGSWLVPVVAGYMTAYWTTESNGTAHVPDCYTVVSARVAGWPPAASKGRLPHSPRKLVGSQENDVLVQPQPGQPKYQHA